MKPSLLIVDDEFALREALKVAFSSEFNVYTAATLREAEKCIFEQEFHIILLDFVLPDGSGLKVLHTLKKLHRVSVVVLISAYNELSDVIEGFKLGASEFIKKPFTLSALRNTLSRFCSFPAHQFENIETITETVLKEVDTAGLTFQKAEEKFNEAICALKKEK